jgi:hypothetical protein
MPENPSNAQEAAMNMKHDRGPTMLSVNTAADRLGVRVEVLRASAYARLIPHTVCDREI